MLQKLYHQENECLVIVTTTLLFIVLTVCLLRLSALSANIMAKELQISLHGGYGLDIGLANIAELAT